MTAELVRGQNHPLTEVRLEIRVSAGTPLVAAATLGDENGKVRGAQWVVHPGAPARPGLEVPRQAAAGHRLALDLGAMPEAVHRVSVLLALPASGPGRFGAVAAPFVAVTGLDGTELAGYTIIGLDAETAVIALELYRRQGAWKVRAVGQGYAGGLAELLADQGLSEAHHLAATVEEAVARGLARSVAAPPPRPADGDRARHTATPGPEQTGPASASASSVQQAVPNTAPAQPGTPHHNWTNRAPGQPAPQPPYADNDSPRPPYPDGSPRPAPASDPQQPVPATGPQSSASTHGPVDYTHPRRQSTAPPTPPPTAPPAPPGRAAQPVAGDATGWSMDERLYNQVWGMFEDLARTTAAYRSAVDFADSRRDKELDQALSDPRGRMGGQGDAARAAAHARYTALVDQARAAFDRDLAQLTAESEVVEPALPPAFARWDNPVWHGYRVPMEIPMAVRLGDLHLPENPSLRIPMLQRLPLERGLWIDSGRSALSDDDVFADEGELRRLAMEAAVAHAARLLAVHPAGEFGVHVIDAAGAAARTLAPLVRSGVLAAPPAAGAAGVADVLGRLTQRVDLVQMAVRGGAPDALPPGFDTSEQLLVVNDFPHGFDDRAVNQLRYLADEGPAVGVHLMMVADREDATAYGPLLDPLWRSLLRLTPVPDDHLADPWVGHAWTYEPALVPAGSRVLEQVLAQVAAARREWNR
ncbi:TerD family protein [Streptomyces naganishii]|uniref:Export associated protein n=1 Tax=Streptomyces naganishii JCM 4654 TaxID=1306179 RepID=A0A918XZX6_9ACTN|nr:TerD family protein [Streptomyces naganishii]GHD84308.1 export associated protein [Streptomyces naganishii JCM 4654]